MATEVALSNLDTYLASLADNTPSTPYEIEITGTDDVVTTANINQIIIDNAKYVNLEETEFSENLETYTFKDNTYLVGMPQIPEQITSLQQACENCTNLVKAAKIPNNVTNLVLTFCMCSNLTVLEGMPRNSESVINMTGVFYGCNKLHNCGIIEAKSVYVESESLPEGYSWTRALPFSLHLATTEEVDRIGRNRKVCLLIWSKDALENLQIKHIMYNGFFADIYKVYGYCSTTSDHTYGLQSYAYEVSSTHTTLYDVIPSPLFPNTTNARAFDFDELEDGLAELPENTADTPYDIYVGGGLTKERLNGRVGGILQASELAQIITHSGRYVDLKYLSIPSDCTSLVLTASCSSNEASSYDYDSRIVGFCEIPKYVTDMWGFVWKAASFKHISDDNLIPSNVLSLNMFSNNDNCDLPFLRFDHELTSEYNISDIQGIPYFYTRYYSSTLAKIQSSYCDAVPVLYCTYDSGSSNTDLDDLLARFTSSHSNVKVLIEGLEEEDLISNGSSSPYSASDLCLKLLGTNITDSTVKGYVASSTFDLRLTEIPSTQTSLKGCFSQGNVSYCFAIPNSVTNMADTFYKCPLVEAPVLPSSLTNMSGTFVETNITTPPVIPSNVTNMYAAFYGTEITTMPDIPNGVTTLARCFECSNMSSSKHPLFTTTKQIPSSVTNMYSCFSGCDRLTTVENIPGYVTDLSYCFINCSSLVTVNNFAVDMSNSNVLKHGCFTNCTSLARINTVTQPAKKQQTWINYTIKTNSSDTNKYDITARYYTENGVQTVTKQIDKYKLKSVITDEILFCANGTLSDSYIENMMRYQFPWGDKLDPSKKNFILWADENGDVYTNLGSKGFVQRVNNVQPDNNGNVTIKTSDITNDSGYITSSASITGSSGSCTGNAATATKLKTARSITIKDYSDTFSGTAVNFDGSGDIILKMPQVIQTYVRPIVGIITSSVSKNYANRDTRYIVTTAGIELQLTTSNQLSPYEGCITEVYALKNCTLRWANNDGSSDYISMLENTTAKLIYYNSGYHFCGVYGAVWN